MSCRNPSKSTHGIAARCQHSDWVHGLHWCCKDDLNNNIGVLRCGVVGKSGDFFKSPQHSLLTLIHCGNQQAGHVSKCCHHDLNWKIGCLQVHAFECDSLVMKVVSIAVIQKHKKTSFSKIGRHMGFCGQGTADPLASAFRQQCMEHCGPFKDHPLTFRHRLNRHHSKQCDREICLI